MNVNYKSRRYYNTQKYPIRQPRFFVWLIYVLCRIILAGKPYKVEKVNMEGLKPPYILLSNHMHFVDFELTALGTWPHRVNNVVSVDGYYMRGWLMELIGCIGKRKFTTDLHLVRSISRVLKRGDILCMYPEARYTPIGTTAPLPDSLGKLVKMNKVPVVVAVHHGNYLHTPFWNFRKKRKVPLHTVLTQVLTARQVAELSVAEINAVIRSAMEYDEYRYQKEQGILITEPFRAEGLHKVLYQCPHCLEESKMDSRGTHLFCTACGKTWNLNEDGSLTALEGETEFSHIPHWFEWERAQVRAQVRSGTYSFSDTVDVHSLPTCYRFVALGKATLTHDAENGFVLEGFYRGKPYRIHRAPESMIGLHVEYDFIHVRPDDCIDICTDKDSFFCFPEKKDVLTKLSFATEEIHALKMEQLSARRAASV